MVCQKNCWRCFLAGLALSGVLLDFLEKQLPFGPGSARLMCQAASVPTALRPDNIDTLLKYCACHAKHERCIYIYIHACNNKQKHAKKRGNPPPSRHPDHNFVSALWAPHVRLTDLIPVLQSWWFALKSRVCCDQTKHSVGYPFYPPTSPFTTSRSCLLMCWTLKILLEFLFQAFGNLLSSNDPVLNVQFFYGASEYERKLCLTLGKQISVKSPLPFCQSCGSLPSKFNLSSLRFASFCL